LKKVSFIFGTRPEAIKLAPVIDCFRQNKFFETEVCITGQHREMLAQTLEIFNIVPDHDLSLMQQNQSLAGFTSRALSAIDQYLSQSRPAAVFVQGDTSTVLATAIASFYHKTALFHVEAGLRTNIKYSPYPEEMNRLLTSRIAEMHFAPTTRAVDNLVREGVDPATVHLTGNTSIDALLSVAGKIRNGAVSDIYKSLNIPGVYIHSKKTVLITGHRRENFGEGFINICNAIRTLAQTYRDYLFVYPVHMNPNVRKPVYEMLNDQPNIKLIEPLNYIQFVAMMDAAHIIMTDSGGVQEEAPSLGKPLLVLREDTERPEGIEAGCAFLVGTEYDKITTSFNRLMNDKELYDSMAATKNPYGDGKASERIHEISRRYFE